MIRIAIVEDEDSYVQVLTGYLKQYETEHSLSFQISVFHDGLDIVSEYKSRLRYHSSRYPDETSGRHEDC